MKHQPDTEVSKAVYLYLSVSKYACCMYWLSFLQPLDQILEKRQTYAPQKKFALKRCL